MVMAPYPHFYSSLQAARIPNLWNSWTKLRSSKAKAKLRKIRSSLRTTVISPQQGQPLFCVLASCAAVAQVLETRTKGHLSSPVTSIALGTILSSLRVIPSTAAMYDNILNFLMPMAVALILLETDLQRAFTDAGPTLKAFWIGAAGTIMGTIVAFQILGKYLGPDGWKMASCLCASYIGGTINYAATAQALNIGSGSTLAAGIAADNLAMMVYFTIIMSIPDGQKSDTLVQEAPDSDSARPTVESIILSLATAATSCILGNVFASILPSTFAGSGLAIMSIVASAFSAIAARLYHSQGTKNAIYAGSEVIGGALMLLFFSVVGASCSVREALSAGWPLFAFILVLLIVHLVFIFGVGLKCQLPVRAILVASNANIGGPATAAAMAKVRCWGELLRPSILVGTLGYTVGTGIGCAVGTSILRSMF